MRDDDAERAEKARRFAEFANRAARAAGYKLDGPRAGGKKDLARDSGISAPSISRMLSGQAIPHPRFFPGLAGALKMSLHQLHVESGLAEYDAPPPTPPAEPDLLTPAQAAERVGIRRPSNIRLAVSFLSALLEEEDRPGVEQEAPAQERHDKHPV